MLNQNYVHRETIADAWNNKQGGLKYALPTV